MKKFISFIAIGFILISSGAFAASSPDEQWRYQRADNLTDHKSIVINDGLMPLETYSYLWAENHEANGNFSRYVCTSTSEKNCDKPQQYRYQAIFPYCSDASDSDCVEGLSAISSSGKSEDAIFQEYSLAKQPNNFKDDPTLGVLHNSNPSIWNLTSAAHNGGTKYAVVAGVTGVKLTSDPSVDQSIFAYVVPVSIFNKALQEIAYCRQATNADNLSVSANTRCTGAEFVYQNSQVPRCAIAYGNEGACLVPEKFPTDYRFNLKLRLSKNPIGWFHGRITSPEIALTTTKTGGATLSVSANPVQVPVFVSAGLWKDLGDKTRNWWTNEFVNCRENCGPAGGTHADDLRVDVPTSFIELNQYPYGDFSLNLIKTLASEVGDKAVVAPTIWSFKTLQGSNSAAANQCISSGSGLKGIVTTNSTTYSQGAPTFNSGELSYKVASLHMLADGSAFKGTYDLILRSDVARCLYNFTKAPISATIEVVSESGVNQVATTTVNEKDGWLYLSAKNFTFSSPTVKVKLTQGSENSITSPSPTPTPSQSVTPSPASSTQATSSKATAEKKTTITCYKGKTIKKITAVNPKCPIGYKKK